MKVDSARKPAGQTRWTFEDGDLEGLREGIERVLEIEAGSLALHAHIDGDANLGRVLAAKAVDLGWLAIGLPDEFGGLGFGPRGLDLLNRQLGRRTAPGAFIANLAAAQTIADAADPATRAEWLPKIISGQINVAVPAQVFPVTSDDPQWLLGAPDAQVALVQFDEAEWGIVKIASKNPVELWDSTRAVFGASFEQGEPLKRLHGERALNALIRHYALALASDSIGGARAIVEQTIAYMQEREQFGRVIASYQALKHRIADLMTLVVSGEEVVAQGVDAVAAETPDAGVWAALAKARMTEAYVHVCQDCLQLHGGVGYTWEFDVHVYLKRARLNEMLLAPNPQLRDWACAGLADVTRAGLPPLELAL